MKAATKRALTVSSVQRALQDARADLSRARAELPEAQRQAGLAYISQVTYSSEAARAKVRDLEDVVAGLEMLLPIAEHRELAVELETLEGEHAKRQPRISGLTERYVALNREISLLPAEPMRTFLAGGQQPDEHPKRTEARALYRVLSEIQSADEYEELRIKELRTRLSMLESKYPYVRDAA